MKKILPFIFSILIMSSTMGQYIPIEENEEIKKLRQKLEEEISKPNWYGILPQTDPYDFKYKLKTRILAQLYFSENGLFFEGELMTNEKFEETLYNLKKRKAKKIKSEEGLWIYVAQDGDSDESYFIDGLIIIKKLGLYSTHSDGDYIKAIKKINPRKLKD